MSLAFLFSPLRRAEPSRADSPDAAGSSSCPRFLQLSRPSEADDTLASLNGRMLEGRRVRLQRCVSGRSFRSRGNERSVEEADCFWSIRYGQERERRGLSNRDVLHSIYFPSSSREARRALDNSLHDSWRWRSRRARVLSSQIRTKKQSGELSAHKRREPEPRPSKLVDLSLDLGVSNLNLDLLPSHSLHSTLALHLLFSYPALLRRHSPLVYDRRRSVDLDLGGSNGDRGRSGLSVERGGSGLSGVVDGGGMGRSLTGGSVDGGREWFEEERSLRTLRRRLEVDGEWSYSARS